MYPGSLPLIFNGSVPGHEKLFNVRRCSMYRGVQFDRFLVYINMYVCMYVCMYICMYVHTYIHTYTAFKSNF